MEFYEDEAIAPMGDDDYDVVDDNLAVRELWDIPFYDVPAGFDVDSLIVIVKGFQNESDEPTLLFRASGNLAPFEIRALLTEGLKEMTE